MNILNIKKARENIAEVINKVYNDNETFIITKFGKPHAKIVPTNPAETPSESRKQALENSGGLWKDNKLSKRENSRTYRSL